MSQGEKERIIENIIELAREKPDYLTAIEEIYEWELENKKEDTPYVNKERYPATDTFFTFRDIQISPQKLHHLHNKGILSLVTHAGGGGNKYCLKDREAIEEALDKVEDRFEEGVEHINHNFPDPEDLPDDLFREVKGYEDIKWLLKRGITTDEITNFLFVGPTGSAKTVFLMCMRDKLEGAKFVSATDATSSGFIDVLFSEKPKYILYDEIDDMSSKDQKSLSQYMETGLVQETKFNKTRELKINCKTIASANSVKPIKDNILDRFTILQFDEYTRGEFIEVCEYVLPLKQDKSEEESRMIAEAVWDIKNSGDVRQAIQVARLSRGDPKKVIEVLDDYSAKSINNF